MKTAEGSCGAESKKMEKMEAEESEAKESEEKEDEEEEMSEKSELTENDLEKSLEKLAELAGDTETSRKDELLSKAQTGELEDSEREELFGLLGGKIEKSEEPSFEDELTKSLEDLAEDEDAQRVLDVSDYLSKSHEEIVKALGSVAGRMESNEKAAQEFNIVLAKSMYGMHKTIQGMAERLEAVEGQPARAPKSVGAGHAVPLAKSFGGTEPAENQLSKADAMRSLGQMIEKAMDEENQELANRLVMETAKVEQGGTLDARVAEQIKQFRAAS